MNYLDGFRDPGAARYLRGQLDRLGSTIAKQGRTVRLMEVCGSHTMAIARFGIRDLLPVGVELLSGPGCPVCVTSTGYVDAALEIARRGAIVATFGDMLRVPGSGGRTLAQARAEGARIEICYSPEGALRIAQAEPREEIVFLGIGFETTIAPVISLVAAAERTGLRNVSVLTAFKLVPPALEALVDDSEVRIDGFLCPAHVSVVIGSEAYRPIVEKRGLPCVVAGFEPLDVLYAVVELVDQLARSEASLVNHYSRVVRPEGNPKAQALIARYLEPVDASWRGMGVLARSGLGLRAEFEAFDAARRFMIEVGEGQPDRRCRCGEVLRGTIRPYECGIFGTVCTPDTPVGACMVSSEGSCAASYRYERRS